MLSPFGSNASAKKTQINFLLITIDTLRPDRLSCYSEEHLQTPHIDSLARKGALFHKAFAHTPTTLPSHTNILLGTNPVYHGVHDNQNFIVREEFLTLAEHLKSNGYSTGAFVGAFPLDSRFGLTQGFDVYDDNYGSKNYQEFSYVERRAEVVVQKALNWLKDQSDPWFLWIHCFDPHDPYEPPEPFKTQYGESLYDGEVAYVDHELGRRFVQYINEHNLFDETLIIFTGDHGESLGQHGEMTHGYLTYNTTIWVPLIISYPGAKPGRADHYVGHIDIFPTVCDILQVKKPDAIQGVSLLPGMKGKKLPRRAIYFESLYPYYSRGWAPMKGFIHDRRKFIESPIPEFYDLKEDFDEFSNLVKENKLDGYRKQLAQIVEESSHPGSDKAQQRIDRKSIQRLQSLGYISSPQISRKKNFGPEDDVKTLLPYHNKAVKAWKLYMEGKIHEGFDLVKEVLTERKDVDIAYTQLAQMYKEQGKLKEALEVLELALEHIPSNYGTILTYVSYLSLAGRYDNVLKILEEKQLPQMENDPEIWNYLGLAYSNKRDFEKAIDALEISLSIDDEYAVAYRSLGTAYLSRFLEARNKEDLEKSIRNFGMSVDLEPEYAAAYNSLGVAYKEYGQTEEAIRCWEKAFEFRSDVGYPLLNLGLAYMEKGNKIKALDYFTRYKNSFYLSLPPEERDKLDALIRRCERRP